MTDELPCAGVPLEVQLFNQKTGQYETYYQPHVVYKNMIGEYLMQFYKTSDEAEAAARMKAAELRQQMKG